MKRKSVTSPVVNTTPAGESYYDVLFEQRIEDVTSGLTSYYSKLLYKISKENVWTIINYIISMRTEVNLSDHYRRDAINILSNFSNYCNDKPFKQITRENILLFLDSFRKPEAYDPLHKWIGTYNLYRIHLIRFFKWLYYSDVEPDKRPKPEVIKNVLMLKRKEQSIYKPTDLWTAFL